MEMEDISSSIFKLTHYRNHNSKPNVVNIGFLGAFAGQHQAKLALDSYT